MGSKVSYTKNSLLSEKNNYNLNISHYDDNSGNLYRPTIDQYYIDKFKHIKSYFDVYSGGKHYHLVLTHAKFIIYKDIFYENILFETNYYDIKSWSYNKNSKRFILYYVKHNEYTDKNSILKMTIPKKNIGENLYDACEILTEYTKNHSK